MVQFKDSIPCEHLETELNATVDYFFYILIAMKQRSLPCRYPCCHRFFPTVSKDQVEDSILCDDLESDLSVTGEYFPQAQKSAWHTHICMQRALHEHNFALQS